MKDNLLKNFLKFSYGSWIGMIIGLVTTMVITRLLTPESFGKFSMYELFVQMSMVFAIFGSDQAFIRFFYEEEKEKRTDLLYNSMKIPILTTIIILIGTFLFYKPITSFVFGEANISYVWYLNIGIITQLIFRYAQLVVRMQQKGNIYSVLQMLQRAFDFVLILSFFYLIGDNFQTLVSARIVTILLLIIVAIYSTKDFWFYQSETTKQVRHTKMSIFKYGSPFVFTVFISLLFQSFDKIALRQWSDFDELGIYSAAMKLVALVMILRTTFSNFWTPVAFEKYENEPENRKFFRLINSLVAYIMLLVGIISIAFREVIAMLLGEQFQEAAIIVPFLIFMPVFFTISETTVMGINFVKKTYWHILISTLACGSNITLNWLLVPEYGAIGAAIATAISIIIFFSLRTFISYYYYRVPYTAGRMYFMIGLLFVYSSLAVIGISFWENIFLGIAMGIVLTLVYQKEIKYIISNKQVLMNS
ncbi:lipopolysaccharide biosynthesis protein [Alkalibacillus almallahensis]|uniref:lipopolysaccharide biosynthesis protein n=1 Tax=Alkalibacillus almallahensis TaxID=1379154 RepID=UPI00141F70B5|nr:oligosaccharide flippase family protein [Alkalibacillus almallahensis]NIK11789.1 O-antigen/teichoic acid export membrane protein [Alkalibacillus almallahensis]